MPCAAAAQPAPPQLTQAQGVALVSLARAAMQEYLDHRTPAQRQAIPADAQPLTQRNYVVAVTLNRGQRPARAIGAGGGDLAHNTIIAALAAMRSPELPDRITQATLDSLVVEVEVLGPPLAVTSNQAGAMMKPGLLGLRASLKPNQAAVLPSDAYVEGMNWLQMRRRCAGRLESPGLGANEPAASRAAQEAQWQVFATCQFVGYPDGVVLELFRGKDLRACAQPDDKDLTVALLRTGDYLLRHQNTEGLYLAPPPVTEASSAGAAASAPVAGTGPASAPEPARSLREHAHGAYAMAMLGRQAQNAQFTESAVRAVSYGLKRLRGDGRQAYLPSTSAGESLAATAMLLLAADELGPQSQSAEIRAAVTAMTNYVASQASALGAELGQRPREPAAASNPAAGPAGAGRDMEALFIALAALRHVDPAAPTPQSLAPQIDWTHLDDGAKLWRAWALGTGGNPADMVHLRPVEDPAPDEVGGVAMESQEPRTDLTALYAIALARAPRRAMAASESQSNRATSADCRRFLHCMGYKPHEAYFAADQRQWLGGVRQVPGSARVTVDACAWTIEAMLE